MKKSFLSTLFVFLTAFLFAQSGFRNPVIPGFYPDPSVCRVGGDFYLVTSSFEYSPGVPVFRSKDLINWTQVGHCLTRPSQLPLKDAAVSGGIYAPTIRYNDGVYYMVTTNVSGRGNFYVFTKDPAREWSEPIWVEQGGIDPTIFFENGKAYFISIPDGIQICEIDIKTGKKLSPSKVLWRGTGGRYPEAPHVYKKDNWYYLLIAEGGTEYGHKITIARSRNLEGPYAENPANPILTHINQNAQTNPIQGVGHGDFVQAQDGSWWVVFLGFRPQSGTHHLLGRETFLSPMSWERNAWPVINGNGTVDLHMNCSTLPLYPVTSPSIRSDFNDPELSMEWCYLRNPNLANYSLKERKGYLRLKPTVTTLDDLSSPTFVGRRQQHINFTATAELNFQRAVVGDEAGMTVFMNNNFHYDFCVSRLNNRTRLILKFRLGAMSHVEKDLLLDSEPVSLRITGTPDYYYFAYSSDNKTFKPIGRMDTRLLSTETAGGFTGIFLGLYATAIKEYSTLLADFNWFDYDGKNE